MERTWRQSVARDDPWELVHREVDRSRRHDRPLALLRFPGTPRSRPAMRRAITVIERLRTTIRSADTAWVERGSVYVLLTESDREAALGLLARLGGAQLQALTSGDDVRVACFPQDGITANALRAVVRRRPGGSGSRTRAGAPAAARARAGP